MKNLWFVLAAIMFFLGHVVVEGFILTCMCYAAGAFFFFKPYFGYGMEDASGGEKLLGLLVIIVLGLSLTGAACGSILEVTKAGTKAGVTTGTRAWHNTFDGK